MKQLQTKMQQDLGQDTPLVRVKAYHDILEEIETLLFGSVNAAREYPDIAKELKRLKKIDLGKIPPGPTQSPDQDTEVLIDAIGIIASRQRRKTAWPALAIAKAPGPVRDVTPTTDS